MRPWEVSTWTRQSNWGCALRSAIESPVQRTETQPPSTTWVRSCRVGGGGGAGLGVVRGVGAALGVGVATRRGGAGVADGLAAAVGFWVAVGLGAAIVGAGSVVGTCAGTVGIVATLTLVMSRPARSMANHAVADTPTTAASQIAAMPPAERRVITIWPLCHAPQRQPAKRTTPPTA